MTLLATGKSTKPGRLARVRAGSEVEEQPVYKCTIRVVALLGGPRFSSRER